MRKEDLARFLIVLPIPELELDFSFVLGSSAWNIFLPQPDTAQQSLCPEILTVLSLTFVESLTCVQRKWIWGCLELRCHP